MEGKGTLMIQPIKPKDVKSTKPDEVIEVFNELIQKYWDGTQARFKQDEAARLISAKMEKSTKYLYENHYLDIEDLYRQAGWTVEYDKPGFNESYPATFTFSA